ncbi:26S proteasome non-ATPase regulatory subunit 9-like protein [Gaertneriomyces semiglobifer]|nr:26S proteasome non-ATPase regulatory subunit 9-like protein [Gaertneriomyces semiglobifer]
MTKPTYAELVENAQKLIGRKEALEREITELQDVLRTQGVGMTESLTDSEGFPRADVDVYAVRNARVRIIQLRNDHTGIMKEIETALHQVHAQAKVEAPSAVETTRDEDLLPLAKVNAVAPDSPAAEADFRRNDLVLRFGDIDAQRINSLTALPALVAANENRPLRVLVRREERLVRLTVTPHKWSGQGLLGCHIVPV